MASNSPVLYMGEQAGKGMKFRAAIETLSRAHETFEIVGEAVAVPLVCSEGRQIDKVSVARHTGELEGIAARNEIYIRCY